MFDDFKTANYPLSVVSPELFARHMSRLFTGDVIDGLNVEPGTGLQVILNPGNTFIRYGSSDVASARLVSLVADFALTIGTPDLSNPRIDLVVVYVDNAEELPEGEPGVGNLDGPGVAKAMIVAGTPNSSPSAPNSTAIQSAVGSGNPYTVVAQVRVEVGVSVIAENKITDVRDRTTPVVKTAGITQDKINFASSGLMRRVGKNTKTTTSTLLTTSYQTFATVTGDTFGGECEIFVSALIRNAGSGSGNNVDLKAVVNGSDASPILNVLTADLGTPNEGNTNSFVFFSTPAAGSQTITFQAKANANSSVYIDQVVLIVTEKM